MLTFQKTGTGNMTVFFLHLLGGSARGWDSTIEILADAFCCVAVDLPGFGSSAEFSGTSVAEMVDAVIQVIQAENPYAWMLVGHSLGAKVAAVVARRAEHGETGLTGLCGMVLLAGSPPSPEPIPEKRRKEMQSWFAGSRAENRVDAETFVDSNSGDRLSSGEREHLLGEVLRMNRAAWLSWFDVGSREDWSRRVGVLKTPAVIIAGADDADLGPDAQQSLMMPHFVDCRLEVLAGAKHLLPMECPKEVANSIAAHARVTRTPRRPGTHVGVRYQALIDSDRVSPATRRVLQARAEPDDPAYEPDVLTLEELFTLRAVMNRIVPQAAEKAIDLAARLDRQLAGEGDGWRYAALPPYAHAYRAALLTLDEEAKAAHKRPFGVLSPSEQDALLLKACEGSLGNGLIGQVTERIGLTKSHGALSAAQMQLWSKVLRGDAVRIYVAHPVTLERMGYSGIADASNASEAQGFTQIGLGQREPWEPSGKQKVAR